MGRSGDREFYAFVRKLIQLRKSHPVFCRPRFFHGEFIENSPVKDITWLAPEGRELSEQEWRLDYARCFGFHLGGDTGDYYSRSGIPLVDQRFIVLVNAHYDSIPFILPDRDLGDAWVVEFDTARPDGGPATPVFNPAETYRLKGRSLVLLRQRVPRGGRGRLGGSRPFAPRERG